MRYLEDPQQRELFDVFANIFLPVAYRRLSIDSLYALNLQPENRSLCRRTIERYIKFFHEVVNAKPSMSVA